MHIIKSRKKYSTSQMYDQKLTRFCNKVVNKKISSSLKV